MGRKDKVTISQIAELLNVADYCQQEWPTNRVSVMICGGKSLPKPKNSVTGGADRAGKAISCF